MWSILLQGREIKLDKKQKTSYCVPGSKEKHAPLAQLVERRIYTSKVGGSSPSGRTIHDIYCIFKRGEQH